MPGVRLIFLSGLHENKVNSYLFVETRTNVNVFQFNNFLFSPKFRGWRHLAFWVLNVLFFATIWTFQGERSGFGQNTLTSTLWIPMRILFCYPLIYWALPEYLLKEKYL